MTDVVVIGAGAAGLMCAIVAGQRGKSVLVLERGERIGAKILISGGGRCNFTNLGARPENYLSSNPDFCKSALARYKPEDFIAMVERHGIAYHEKKLGQLFCDHSSREIVEMLRKECDEAGVAIRTGADVTAVRKNETGFEVETPGETFSAPKLVIATGGLSLPKLGATDFAYRIARQFGLNVIPGRAGLVPFTFGGEDLEFCRELSGISAPCVARVEGAGAKSRAPEFAEHFLFTHRGLSGPAMLQTSSYWQAPAELRINLFPGGDARAWLEENRGSGMRLDTLLSQKLPERFASAWTARLPQVRPVRHYAAKELDDIAHRLENWTLRPAGTEGYATAEVTVGGVDTSGLNSKTMEARAVAGLYYIGEAVDVTGWLGGYNFSGRGRLEMLADRRFKGNQAKIRKIFKKTLRFSQGIPMSRVSRGSMISSASPYTTFSLYSLLQAGQSSSASSPNSSVSSSTAKNLANLGTALQSGDLSNAQGALATLQDGLTGDANTANPTP